MSTTSLSLLQRACQDPTSQAWQCLADIYTPLLKRWLGRYALQASDVDDLVQEVLLTVAKELPSFDHSARPGAFRAWLRNILVFRLRNYWRKQQRHPQPPGAKEVMQQLEELADPQSGISRIWDQEHEQHLLEMLLGSLASRFKPATMEAFRRVVLKGEPPEEVARDLDMSLNSVVIAKCRVLKELRNSAEGLLEG